MTNEEIMIYGIGGVICIGLLWLMSKAWFWALAFLTGALAAIFACIASVIHFQILAALGFFFLAAILVGIAHTIAS